MSKLLIVNNSLKDLRGHFFETSLAVAEAARDLGFRPVLGAHASCPRDLAPEWLEFHPIFTTDHWMVRPLPGIVQLAERLLPLHWHQPAHRMLKFPWQALQRSRHLLRSACGNQRSNADPLAQQLDRAGIGEEFQFVQRFRADLQAFMKLSDCQDDDHVFLPTAHGRELAAIQRLDTSARPQFHLEFRHDLEKFRYRVRHRIFFDDATQHSLERIQLYTDTEELSEEYEAFSRLPFAVLPIPFRARLMEHAGDSPRLRNDAAAEPICIAYFGDVRDEKGFHWLPELINALRHEPCRFLIQASIDPMNRNPRSMAALHELKRTGNPRVELIGANGPLTPEQYYGAFAGADVLLCPYDGVAYRSRSSGTFTEAIAAGLPTVVPADSWMARQQPPGGGVAFRDRASFISGVRRICSDFASYRAAAERHSDGWLSHHSPENLVRCLLHESSCASAAMPAEVR